MFAAFESEKTKLPNPVASPSSVSEVKVPQPAGITAPVNENPKTVDPPVETLNPASLTVPPAAS